VVAATGAADGETEADAIARLDLTDSERNCLARCQGSPGLRLTSTIGRSWRAASLRRTARLTLGALPEPARTVLLDDWLDRSHTGSFYYASEAVAFLSHVVEQTSGIGNLIARFELAAHQSLAAQGAGIPRLKAPDFQGEETLVHHPAADLMEFWVPPREILAAASRGEPLPRRIEGRYLVLVAPGIEGLARMATEAEALIWEASAAPVAYEVLSRISSEGEHAIAALVEAGAIVRGTARSSCLA